MTNRKLTPEQIDNLFEFCEFHNVHYYDVQIELVDHLASSVEALWETSPELTFEEAVFQVGEQFGVVPYFQASYLSLLPSPFGKKAVEKSGFETIKEAKEKELRRKYNRLQLNYIGEFFRLPKIILTLTITFTLFFVFKITGDDQLVSIVIQGIYIFSLAVFFILIFPKKLRLKIIDGKSFLLYDQFKTIRKSAIGAGFASYNIVVWISKINQLKSGFLFSSYISTELLTAVLITLFGIMMVALCVYTPHRVKEDFVQEFPQFIKS